MFYVFVITLSAASLYCGFLLGMSSERKQHERRCPFCNPDIQKALKKQEKKNGWFNHEVNREIDRLLTTEDEDGFRVFN